MAEGQRPSSGRPSAGNIDISPDILRGVPVSHALKKCGSLWRTSPCDLPPQQRSELYGLSRPCDRLDAFVSHAWSSAWWQKYLTLLIHYFWWPALATGLLAALALCVLDGASLLPHFPTITRNDDSTVRLCPWSWIPPTMMLAVLFLGPALFQHGQRNQKVFLDLVCISQADDRLKKEGISSIAGFLDKSFELIVLWSPHNLSRMWCVFELAVFSALQDSKEGNKRKVSWRPLFVHSYLFGLFVVLLILYLLMNIRVCLAGGGGYQHPVNVAGVLIMYLAAVSLFHHGRVSMREKHHFLEKLMHFEVDNVDCRDPRDKEYVKQSICHWYGSESKFNEFVRKEVSPKVRAAVASLEATYPALLIAVAPRVCYGLEWIVAFARSGQPLRTTLPPILIQVALSLCTCPAYIKIALSIMDSFHRRCGGRMTDVACSALLTLLWFLFVFCIDTIGWEMRGLRNSALYLAITALGALLVFRASCASRACSCARGAKWCPGRRGSKMQPPRESEPAETTDASFSL